VLTGRHAAENEVQGYLSIQGVASVHRADTLLGVPFAVDLYQPPAVPSTSLTLLQGAGRQAAARPAEVCQPQCERRPRRWCLCMAMGWLSAGTAQHGAQL
jgi:hypothetical protein